MTDEPINIRVAQFNASLNRSSAGQLITDLSTPDNAQAKAVAEIIQRTAADIILINEFDFDRSGPGGSSLAARLFQDNYLSIGQNGAAPIDYPYVYIAPSNTGVASGFDLNNNGVAVTTPGAAGYGDDALGFGNYEGQFGMLLLSKHPIVEDGVRTFQEFLWKDMPGALLPDDAATAAPGDWYSPEELEVVRLSSKSHWDVPIEINGEIVHVLAAHPTPPVFDGPEDRNGLRNHDEIRFWADYIDPTKSGYIYDDAGGRGGLGENARFIIVGDYNADPNDGDSFNFAIRQLLNNALTDDTVKPDSAGGPQQAALQRGANATHVSDPSFDTADFADGAPGNLRTDYVLGAKAGLTPIDGQIFWPENTDPLFEDLVGTFPFPSSDHRLVAMDFQINPFPSDVDRSMVAEIDAASDFLGEVTFPTGLMFDGTQVGGLSGLVYDADNGRYLAISDDRSQINPARFYTLDIDLSDGALDAGDVVFTDVTTLQTRGGGAFPALGIDPEGIALAGDGTLYVSSEGEASTTRVINPFIRAFTLDGEQVATLPIPSKFLPTNPAAPTAGIRNNLAFESLTITPDGRFLFSATENALYQDGPAASIDDESPARIIKYDLQTGEPVAEFIYVTDPVNDEPIPSGSFATNGLVELLAIDNSGTLLALERSFSVGVGNAIKLYEVLTQGATDVSGFQSVNGFDIDTVASKRLLLDFADLGLTLDNIEGMALGPLLDDGRPSLIVVSDNNFSGTQFTQFLAFALDIQTLPAVAPSDETPPAIRVDANDPAARERDLDDPAIYLNASDPTKSFVITTEKDAGFTTYDLNGNEIQSLTPDGIRFNNVDLIYGFELDGEAVDLAVFSDRENDTLAIYRIDADTRTLTDVTAASLSDPAFSIFGVDDGEATAYGVATYTSRKDGEAYAYATQADGAAVAQLKLIDQGDGTVAAQVVRTIALPVPAGDDAEDYQSEGIVVDQETGLLFVVPEGELGILRYSAEADGGQDYTIIQPIDQSFFTPDIEGLSIYYGENGEGYLIASSQGDNSFAVFRRDGDNAYLGSFVVGADGNIDGVQETDGIDIFSGPLPGFPFGLMVVQDGSNEPQTVFVAPGDDEIQNYATSFKYVPWQGVAEAIGAPLAASTYDPRTPEAQADVVVGHSGGESLFGTGGNDFVLGLGGADHVLGRIGNDSLDGGTGDDTLGGNDHDDLVSGGDGRDHVSGGAGNDTVDGAAGDDRVIGHGGDDVLDGGAGNDTLLGGTGNDTLTGGADADRFVFFVGGGDDLITDFVSGEDVIVIRDIAGATIDIDTSGADTIITVDGLSITVSDVSIDAGDLLLLA